MHKYLAAFGLFALMCAPAQAQRGVVPTCDQSAFNFAFGQSRTSLSIQPQPGQPCEVAINSFGLLTFEGMRVVRRARYGRVAIGGRNSFVYVPPGPVTPDNFAIRVDTERNGQYASTIIEVSVAPR
jgi:hypothetical protein